MPIAYVRSWDEAKHPRGPGGKFASKPGGGLLAGSLRLQPTSNLRHPESDEFYQTQVPNTKLSDTEREVVKEYAWGGSQFERMNRALRGDPDREIDPATAEGIEKLTGVMRKKFLHKPAKVYRGVPDDEKTRAWLADRDRGTIIDHGFASTSTDRATAAMMADPIEETGGVVLEIKLPVGARAVSIGDQFDAEGGFDQKEVLLQRGSKFKVGRTRKQGGQTVVELTLVSQPG